MEPGAACEMFRSVLPRRVWVRYLGVRKVLVLANKVYRIHSKPIGALIEPVADNVVHCCANIGVLPVQIWLFFCK